MFLFEKLFENMTSQLFIAEFFNLIAIFFYQIIQYFFAQVFYLMEYFVSFHFKFFSSH